MRKIIASYICMYQNDYGTCREIKLLEDGTLYIRVNCIDGAERWYNDPISQFENEYKINISDTDIAQQLQHIIK